MTVLTVDDSGTLTLPRETLLALGIDCRAEVEVEIDEETRTLRVTPHYDDSWAETVEFREGLQEARRDIKEGRVRQMTEEDLRQLAGLS